MNNSIGTSESVQIVNRDGNRTNSSVVAQPQNQGSGSMQSGVNSQKNMFPFTNAVLPQVVHTYLK